MQRICNDAVKKTKKALHLLLHGQLTDASALRGRLDAQLPLKGTLIPRPYDVYITTNNHMQKQMNNNACILKFAYSVERVFLVTRHAWEIPRASSSGSDATNDPTTSASKRAAALPEDSHGAALSVKRVVKAHPGGDIFLARSSYISSRGPRLLTAIRANKAQHCVDVAVYFCPSSFRSRARSSFPHWLSDLSVFVC